MRLKRDDFKPQIPFPQKLTSNPTSSHRRIEVNTRILGRVAELDRDEIHTDAFTLSRERFRDEFQPAAAPESRQEEAGFP